MSNIQSICASPEWWNNRLRTKKGDDITYLIKIFSEKPLELKPEIPALAAMLFDDFEVLGIETKLIRIVPHGHTLEKAINIKVISERFSDILQNIRVKHTARCTEAVVDPAISSLLAAWPEITKEWEDSEEKYHTHYALRSVLWELLLGAIFSMVSEETERAEAYLSILFFVREGNFPLGKMPDDSFVVGVKGG